MKSKLKTNVNQTYLDIILGRNTQPYSSDNCITCPEPSDAAQDLTRISNSPENQMITHKLIDALDVRIYQMLFITFASINGCQVKEFSFINLTFFNVLLNQSRSTEIVNL